MNHFKLGRKAPQPSAKRLRSIFEMTAALDPLGAPPAACNDYVSAVKVPWQMFGNDQYGDCVECDTAHSLMLRTANLGSIVVPTQTQVEALYTTLTGFDPNNPATDQGTDESAMSQFMLNTGWLGHKADAVGTVDHTNLDHVKWVNILAGTCRLGINLPNYSEDQFLAGQPWTVSTTGDQSTGGHDVPLVSYDPNWLYVVSWGRVVPMSYDYYAKYAEEAHAELYFDWANAQGVTPAGLDLNTLGAKLKAILT